MVTVMVLCVVALVWVWSIADVIATDFYHEVRKKGRWIAAVLVVPVVGAIAWLLHGRPMRVLPAIDYNQARPYSRVIRSENASPPIFDDGGWWET